MQMNPNSPRPGHHQDGPAAVAMNILPQFLNEALDDLSLSDQFFDAAFRAAEQAGCQLLFEIPGLLFEGPGDRAAAIACGDGGRETELLFLVFEEARNVVTVVAGEEVPDIVIEFTRSYAGVLAMIASDRRPPRLNVSPLL